MPTSDQKPTTSNQQPTTNHQQPTTNNRQPTTDNPRLTRRKLEKLPRESIHKARNWSKADVSVAEWPPGSGKRVVIKELKNRPLWYRVLAGRYFLRREWRVLCALKDLEAVPSPVARPDSDTIVMEHRAGRQLEHMEPWEVTETMVEKIENLIKAIHARGITHGDLHGHNVLVDDDGNITLIDWATAGIFGTRRLAAKDFTFEEWRALDDRALAKIKIVHAPSEVTPSERDLLLHGGSRIYRSVKKVRHGLERVRGLDEATIAAREEKRDKTLRRLAKYPAPQNEAEKAEIKAKLAATKQHRRNRAEARNQQGTSTQHSP